MNSLELLDIVRSGETSKVQFKKIIDNDDSLAAEMIAMSNSKGGIILIGIEDKTGEIVGLDYGQLQSFNNRIVTIANERVKPQILIETELVPVIVDSEERRVLVADVAEGISKPYKDKNGAIWIKQGSDKRRLTDNNEQIRLFQQSGVLYLDEMIVPGTSANDIRQETIEEYIKQSGKNKLEDEIEITKELLTNLGVVNGDKLTLGGLLFFGKNPQKFRPTFCIKAISFIGNSIVGSNYRSSRDIEGTIPVMFDGAMDFLKSNLHYRQAGQNFNTIGILEISEIALEELVQNALIHRDYSQNAPVRIMIFDNRVEIVSPGSLPNSLTVENIKVGKALVRNNLMASYCSKLMNYRGFGSGIARALQNQSDTELVNDTGAEQFIVRIPRPALQ